MPEEKRRRSRVLEYFEAQEAETPEPEDTPFQGLDAAFGLDKFAQEGNK